MFHSIPYAERSIVVSSESPRRSPPHGSVIGPAIVPFTVTGLVTPLTVSSASA